MAAALAAAGIMGGLALMLAQLTKQQHVTQKKAETGVEITALSNLIVNTLSYGEACKNTIESGGASPAISAGASVTVPELRGKGTLASGRVLLEAGLTYGNRLVKIASMELAVPSGATPVANQIGGGFEVVFERTSKAYTGQKTVSKSFPLTLELDASNNFVGCRSTFDSVALGVKEEICDEMGGTWNGTTGKCVPADPVANKGCSGGRAITGFDSGGNPVCAFPHANRRCPTGTVRGFDNNGTAECVAHKDVVKGMGCADGEAIVFDAGEPKCAALSASPGPVTPPSNPGPVTPPSNPTPTSNPQPACPAGYSRSPGPCPMAYRKGGGGLQYADEDRMCNAKGSSGAMSDNPEKQQLEADSGDPACKRCVWKSISVTCGSCAGHGTCGETSCRAGYGSETCAAKTLDEKNSLCGTDCPASVASGLPTGVCGGGKFKKHRKYTVADFKRHPGNLECFKCDHNAVAGWESCPGSTSTGTPGPTSSGPLPSSCNSGYSFAQCNTPVTKPRPCKPIDLASPCTTPGMTRKCHSSRIIQTHRVLNNNWRSLGWSSNYRICCKVRYGRGGSACY